MLDKKVLCFMFHIYNVSCEVVSHTYIVTCKVVCETLNTLPFSRYRSRYQSRLEYRTGSSA